jgi:hypothetical protein
VPTKLHDNQEKPSENDWQFAANSMILRTTMSGFQPAEDDIDAFLSLIGYVLSRQEVIDRLKVYTAKALSPPQSS